MEPNVRLSRERLRQYGAEALIEDRSRQRDWMFAINHRVLNHFCGTHWVRQHLFTRGPFKPPAYKVDPVSHLKCGMRGHHLAEMLFNLQRVEGFSEVHRRLIAGEIEPVLGELEAGRLLKSCDERFRFVDPQGRAGSDFDIEIFRENGSICCEVKTKLDFDQLTTKNIFNSLKRARQQLPKNRPGLIFLRVGDAENRKQILELRHIFADSARQLLRQTTRIVSAILLARHYDIGLGPHAYSNTTPLTYRIVNARAHDSWCLTDNLSRSLVLPDNWLSFSTELGYLKRPPEEWIREQRQIREADKPIVIF